MLETIGKLRDTLTEVQTARLQHKFGPDWDAFQNLIESDTEETALENFAALKAALKNIGIPKLLAIHGELSNEQKEILREIL